MFVAIFLQNVHLVALTLVYSFQRTTHTVSKSWRIIFLCLMIFVHTSEWWHCGFVFVFNVWSALSQSFLFWFWSLLWTAISCFFFNNLWQKERCVSNFSTLRLVPCLCSAAIIVFFFRRRSIYSFFLLPDQAISASCAVLIAHGCDSVR